MDWQFANEVENGFGIGEYHQLVATDNTVFAFWADGRTNDEDLNIYMAKVSLNDIELGVEELGPLRRKSVFPLRIQFLPEKKYLWIWN